jgi:hypothetical protein
MTGRSYTALMHELCAITGLPDPDQLVETGRTLIDDFAVDFSYRQAIQPDSILVSVDLGAIDADGERDVYRKMLETNVLLAEAHTGQVGLNAESGRAIFCARVPFDHSLDGHGLVGAVERIIAQAQFVRHEIGARP